MKARPDFVAITKTGKHYARRKWNRVAECWSWDQTTDLQEAHRFGSRRAAENHAKHWPEGWTVRRISKDGELE